MAHSIQVIGDRSAILNDLDLLVLILLMNEEIDNNPRTYPLLVSIAGQWRASSENYAPGAIELNLELAVGSEDARRQFETLLSAVARKLERAAETIPEIDLNSRMRVPGVTFQDFPTHHLLAAIKKIRKLLLPVNP